MRILMIGKRRYTNQDALVQRFGRIYRLPLHWRKCGNTVELILVDYFGKQREISSKDGFEVLSLPAIDPRSLRCMIKSAAILRPNVIVASGDCFVGLLGLLLARRVRAKLAFDVYDDYRTFGAYRAFMGWDALGFLCRHADLVMYASRVMDERHAFLNCHMVVPNGVDTSSFHPMSMAQARQDLDLPSDVPLIGYFGSMTAEHGVEVLVRAFKLLRAKRKDLHLLICGKNRSSTPLDEMGLIYRGLLPHNVIPTYLNACNVLALPYLHGAFLDAASSCKIAEYLYCRRPIVATRTPNFIRNFPVQARQLEAVLVAPGDPSALASSMECQLDSPIVVEPPEKMDWSQIAISVLSRFHEICESRYGS